MNNQIRSGIISTVNLADKTVRVTFPDKDNLVSDELPVFRHAWSDVQPPSVGDSAICIFLGNGLRAGYCIGFFDPIGGGG